jgi:hypothetical protein
MTRVALAGALAIATFSAAAKADYLEVRRPSLLKASAERAGDTLRELKTGDVVDLIGAEQIDGYYEVRTPWGQRGYVYRTLVRRHHGPMPPVSPGDDAQTLPAAQQPPPPTDVVNETGVGVSAANLRMPYPSQRGRRCART